MNEPFIIMKRLIEKNLNTPEEYNRIFLERQQKGVDWADMRRWKTLLKYYKGGAIADWGCLDSQISQLAKGKKDFVYDGFDISSIAIANMKFNYADIDLKFCVKDIYNHFSFETYDYIIMGELLEHLEFPKKAIDKIMQSLKSGGILAISTPFNEAIEPGAVDFKHHIWSIDEQDIRDLLEPYVFKIKVKILRSQHFPVYKYCFPQLLVWGWKL